MGPRIVRVDDEEAGLMNGTPALREAALACGADIVLEKPVPLRETHLATGLLEATP